MATATDNLKAYYETKAGLLPNEENRLLCLSYISTWYAAQTAIDALAGQTISSYSLNGRSVTRRDMPNIEKTAFQYLAYVRDLLTMNGIALVDNRGFYTQGWPVAGGSVTL